MADYKVKSYSSYASSMSKPTSSGMSSKLDSKGYTPKSTSSSSVADKKGYTPTKSTSTASGKKYASTYNDNYESPKTDKTKYSTTGLGAKQQPKQPQTAKQGTEDRFASAYVSAGGTDSMGVYKPQPMNLYEKPSMQVVQDYLTSTAIQDSLYEAQGLINQATTPQMQMSIRPMTAEEIKKFAPVKELTEKGITVEELSAMDAPTQKATLESLGITNAQWASYQPSMFERFQQGVDNFAKNVVGVPEQSTPIMSLREFDDITKASVHYGNPYVRDPKNTMYNTIQQPTQQGLGYNQADITPVQPSAEQATILPNSQAMMVAPTLGEEPNLDPLSNQMLEKPAAATPSAGLMSRRLDEKGAIIRAPTEYKNVASRLVMDLKKDFGLSDTQAAALAGNLAFESGNFQTLQEKKPLVSGSKGGYGFAQWTGPRRKAYEAWTKENGLDPASYEANYGYLKRELSETDPIIRNVGKNTISKLKEINDIDEASTLVEEYFLRPGIPHSDKRKKRAKEVLGFTGTEAKIEEAKTNDEVVEASTESVVTSLPPEQAKTLMTNPVKWVYDQNLMGLTEKTEEGQKAIVEFFNSSLGKTESEYRTAADAATKGGHSVTTLEGAWCATFVDHVLKNLGAPRLEGRQNYNRVGAMHYAKLGTGVKFEDTKAGDVAVFPKHVGFVVGKVKGIATSDKANAKALQAGLTKAGFDAGGVDGLWGPNSAKALTEYQKAKGLEATGNVTPEMFKAITGKDGKVTTNVLVLGGNQDNTVNVTSYPATMINHYRRIGSIKDLDTDTFKAVTKDIRASGSQE